MYEEAESILKKLPKPVEEDVDPPAESWSASPLRRSLHSPTSCHPAKMTRKKKNNNKKKPSVGSGWVDGDVSVAPNRNAMPRKGGGRSRGSTFLQEQRMLYL